MKSQNLNRNWCWLFVLAACLHGWAAAPTFQSFESTQFDTNTLTIKYRSDWTNELGVIRPATVNTEVTLTNLNLYETFVTPAKVYALSLGTNELNVATNTSWLLSSPTNDASQVILSLSAGKFQGQWLLITSQNDTGGFTLPDGSEQYDVPGALVDTQGDWVGTTNRGSILQYVAPDWIEMFRFNPELPAPAGFTIGAGLTNIAGVLSATGAGGGDTIWTNVSGTIQPLSGQTTNRLSFTSGAADNATNAMLILDTTTLWGNDDAFLILTRNAATNIFAVSADGGGIWSGRFGLDPNGAFSFPNPNSSLVSMRSPAWGDPNQNNVLFSVTDSDSFAYYAESSLTHSIANSAAPICQLVMTSVGDTDPSGSVTIIATTGSESLVIHSTPTDLVSFKPRTASTGSAVAHFVDTSSVLINGDSLFQFKNAGVNRVRFQHDGTLSIQNTTNRLGVVAGVLQLDGYNIGGSSSVITYTNQFVYNSKVTYNADVYVTNSSTIYINGVDVRTDWQGGAASDETTALTTSTNVLRMQLPFAATLLGVYASVTTPQASGSTLTLDLKESGTSVLSTLVTIDNTEFGSDTATPAVISDTAIAQFAPLVWSITQVGTPPAGLKVWVKLLKLL